MKIMVVDDSMTIRRTAENLLSQLGCRVTTAANGFEALVQITEEMPDLLLIDIMMPRLDGWQTCALIKSNGRFCGIPVIMLSSRDGIFDKARGKIVGAEEYLTKPFSRDDLVVAIQRFAPTR
jgi:twitching motility two-component system response regulator PilG